MIRRRKAAGNGAEEVVHEVEDKKRGSSGGTLSRATLAPLLAARLLSAALNLIHDCDEVFNYWEPLHYLLYGSGLQTWEYSARFALRSYWYLDLHALVVGPLRWIAGEGRGQIF